MGKRLVGHLKAGFLHKVRVAGIADPVGRAVGFFRELIQQGSRFLGKVDGMPGANYFQHLPLHKQLTYLLKFGRAG